MNRHKNSGSIIRGLALGIAALSCATVSKATPFASCITNNAGTISFYLNESGGAVGVSFDGGASSNYLGVLNAGLHSFSLSGHTTYDIYVSKTGTGAPSLINQYVFSGNQRGVVANGNATSPYFGNIYQVNGGNGLIRYNSDLSFATGSGTAQTAGVSWAGGSYSPDKIAVQTNDLISVADYSSGNATVWMLSPDLSSATQVLAGIGVANGQSANVHGSEESQPVITGSIAGGNLMLQVVDGAYPQSGTQYSSILTYNIGAGPLPWANPPDVVGPSINPNTLSSYGGSTYNFYGSLIIGPNGQVYTCNERANFSNPNLGVYPSAPTATTPLLYDSRYNNNTADYFQTAIAGHSMSLPDDCAVSPDGKYVAEIHLDNHFTIASLDANGIPINTSIYTVAPTSFTGNGRGICFDAADNIISSSSGQADIQEWSLGLTATCVTSGNASGTTKFQVVLPSTTLNVSTSTNVISQTNSYGFPTNGYFTITRTGSVSSPLVVNFTIGGTAATNTYKIAATNTIIIGAGQTSTNVSLSAISDGIARPTTSVILTLSTTNTYAIGLTNSGTILINNTAVDALSIAPGAPTMYKAYSNDFGSFVITRLGDTNAAAFTVSSFTYAGTGVQGVDYTLPAPVTFNPGDVTHTVTISPLVNGNPPTDSASAVYTGNKTATIGINTDGTGHYTVSGTPATVTILDNANPPATVLFSDPLDSSTATADAANWLVTFGNNNMNTVATNGQFEVNFGWDMTTDPDGYHGTVSPAPSGATTALRLTVNKSAAAGSPGGASAGVNVYPVDPLSLKALSFSNSYAVRFNMCLVKSSDPYYATEGVLFGIDHSGIDTNWFAADGVVSRPNGNANFNWSSDGYWMWIDADAGGTTDGDYVGFQGLGAVNNTGWSFIPGGAFGALFYPSYTNAFKDPGPFDNNAGNPAVLSSLIATNNTASPWVDVEIKQVNVGSVLAPTNVITFSINKTPILSYTSTNVYKSGDLMLGYNDPFSSIGQEDSAVFFSNLRVVQLGPIMVTGIALNNGNVVINFTTTDGDDTVNSFNVLSSGASGSAAAVDTVVSGVTFTQLGTGAFQATFPQPGNSATFYRIKHK